MSSTLTNKEFIEPCTPFQFPKANREQLLAELASIQSEFKLPLERLFAGTSLGIEVRTGIEQGRPVVEMHLPEELDPSGEIRWLEPYRAHHHTFFTDSFGGHGYPSHLELNQREVWANDPDYFDHLPPHLQDFKDDFLLMKKRGIPYPFPAYIING